MPANITLGYDLQNGSEISLTGEGRSLGTYIIGLTGTGKTTLLLNIILQDIQAGDGIAVLDPHGDLTDDILSHLPPEREQDVILFEPFETHHPFGLNFFECPDTSDPNTVDLVSSQAMGTFFKLFSYSWGPQMEDLLRVISLTLIHNQSLPETLRPTMAEIPRLLTDKVYRGFLVSQVEDPQVRSFWEDSYPLKESEQREYHRSTINKVRRFLLNTTIRNIVGQATSSFDLRRVMDEGKILLANLSKGRLGEDNSALLGSVLVGKVLIAALSRADQAKAQRRPFHLVVDEYQSFATSDFPTFQAEARKFNIDTVVAHQYREQLNDDNRGSTLNVGNKIVFRINGADAAQLAAEFDNTPPTPLVVGERAKLGVPADPWKYLKEHGHTEAALSRLVSTLQTKLLQIKQEQVPGTVRTRYEDEAYDEQDFLLVENELREYLLSRIQGKSWAEAAVHMDTILSETILSRMGYTFLSGKDILEILRKGQLERYHTGLNDDLSQTLYYAAQQGMKAKNWFITEFAPFLEAIGDKLAASPPLTATGEYEPIYDRPRSYSDVAAETANRLATLPQFTARCKLVEGGSLKEYTLKTLPFPAPGDGNGDKRMERVREQSRALYGRERSAVETALMERTANHGPARSTSYYDTRT